MKTRPRRAESAKLAVGRHRRSRDVVDASMIVDVGRPRVWSILPVLVVFSLQNPHQYVYKSLRNFANTPPDTKTRVQDRSETRSIDVRRRRGRCLSMSTDREFGRFCSSRSCFHCRLLIKMYTHHLGTLQIHHQTQRLVCTTRRRRGPTHEVDTSAHKHASHLTKHGASARPLMAKGCSDLVRGPLGPMAWQVAAPGGQHERDGTRVGAPGRRPRMGP